jgi:hypothetical protein
MRKASSLIWRTTVAGSHFGCSFGFCGGNGCRRSQTGWFALNWNADVSGG